MIFKRRDPKTMLRSLAEFLWPRGGWARAFHYVKHRMRRLPDSPERISRGIWAGVFTAFTPFYGIHFFIAAGLAWLMRGNVLAALMGTFFGNPLTYVPIGVAALQTGHWLLGTELSAYTERSFSGKFIDAGVDLWANLRAFLVGRPLDWQGLSVFYHEVFYPYLVGGVLPGIFFATICYYISVPVLRAYQQRRKGTIKAKFDALKVRSAEKAAAKNAGRDASGPKSE